ncbi:MAG: hypothetical protein K6G74_04090 [Bacilli bacterium]|nr:hypothetical protein [Bacilli bacterium]
MPFEVKLTIYIVVSVFVIGLLAVWFFYTPLRKRKFRRFPKEAFYKSVRKVADNGDFYLVNNVKFDMGGGSIVTIDHLLGGDKFLYVIMDHYFEGAINAKAEDFYWIYYLKDHKQTLKKEIHSPLIETKNIVNRLSMMSGLPVNFLVGIVLINSDCFVNRFQNVEGQVQLVPDNMLSEIITSYEKKEVEEFNPDDLHRVIHEIHDLSEKTKQNEQ